jgi:hypothetical protein
MKLLKLNKLPNSLRPSLLFSLNHKLPKVAYFQPFAAAEFSQKTNRKEILTK